MSRRNISLSGTQLPQDEGADAHGVPQDGLAGGPAPCGRSRPRMGGWSRTAGGPTRPRAVPSPGPDWRRSPPSGRSPMVTLTVRYLPGWAWLCPRIIRGCSSSSPRSPLGQLRMRHSAWAWASIRSSRRSPLDVGRGPRLPPDHGRWLNRSPVPPPSTARASGPAAYSAGPPAPGRAGVSPGSSADSRRLRPPHRG